VLDSLQVIELAGREGNLTRAADASVEGRLGAQGPQLTS
jgi:hypothetical protein